MNLTDDGAYWLMKWDKYPYKPNREVMFEPEKALATLLRADQVFLNTHWWENDWPDTAKETFSIAVNLNDCFVYGSDAHEIFYDDIKDVYDHWSKDPNYGVVVWASKKRNMLPLKRIYDKIISSGVWKEEDFNGTV